MKKQDQTTKNVDKSKATPAIDESIRLVREENLKEKKDAPLNYWDWLRNHLVQK